MNVRDLTPAEWEVLLAMVGHLAEADERIDAGEILELQGLADEFGEEDVMGRVMRARAAVRTRADLLAAAATVSRREVRELMRTLLMDLAQADGERSEAEQALLADITRVWARVEPS